MAINIKYNFSWVNSINSLVVVAGIVKLGQQITRREQLEKSVADNQLIARFCYKL